MQLLMQPANALLQRLGALDVERGHPLDQALPGNPVELHDLPEPQPLLPAA